MKKAFVLVVFLVSCKSLSTGAMETFGTEYSCPESRVTSRERTDIPPADALDPVPLVERAPAEVAADPERLEKWKADRNASRAARRGEYADFEIWEMNGCGHAELLACHHPLGRKGTNVSRVSCRPIVWPPRNASRPPPPISPANPAEESPNTTP